MEPALKTLLTLLFACATLAAGHHAAAAEDFAAEATQAIDSRILNKPINVNMFQTADFQHGSSFVRNPAFWCEDLAVYLTCFSPWNSNEGMYQGGTLITPKHAVFAEHFSGASGSNTLHAGEKVAFVGKTSILYMRTLKATPQRVGTSDICVGTFKESDLPPDVVPAQVLPAGLKDSFLPAGTAIMFFNRGKQAYVGEMVSLTGVVIRPATDPKRMPWTLGGPVYVGDSGSPIFAVVHGRPVLLALFMAPNGGPPVSNQIDGINALLGKGYKVNVMKLGE